MLRITVHEQPSVVIFQLEGRLAGPWVQELEEHLRSALNTHSEPTLRVDLTGVTFIDAAGKACLAALHRQGAELVAPDCLTRGIVDEICLASGVKA
jgi:anti-anti-sigma regulatory factor